MQPRYASSELPATAPSSRRTDGPSDDRRYVEVSGTDPFTRRGEALDDHLDTQDPDWARVAGRRGLRTLFVLWHSDRAVGQAWVTERDEPTVAVEQAIATAPVVDASTGRSPPPSTVSIVVCTRDRPEALERCLATFGAQTRKPDEVIVVDNASRGPETREVTSAAGATYIREDRPGLDIARNTGLLAATSEVVAYTDDDTELHPRWLERTVAAFDDEHILAVTGLVLPAELDTEAQWLFERDWGFGKGYVTRDFGPAFYQATRARGCPAWDIGAGANMAFRKRVVDLAGLFDERLDVGAAGCSGDAEYWYRILARGGTCRYEPAALVFHHHRRDLDELTSQLFHYMRGHAAALLVQYERTREIGNLRRLLADLPLWYLKLGRRFLPGSRDVRPTAYIAQVRGMGSGMSYILRGRLRSMRMSSDAS
jgi:glycosyltransferase involved in cell wall biosynthesis